MYAFIRVALRAIIYFEVVTTLALVVGLVAVNLVRPGVGVALGNPAEAGQALAANKTTLTGVLLHIVPQSFFEAAAQNEVLQVVFWSILFGLGLTQVKGKPKETMLAFCAGVAEVMFKFTGIVMKYAPIGVGAAIAYTVGHGGVKVLVSLGALILTLYGALVVFFLAVLVPVVDLRRLHRLEAEHLRLARQRREPALVGGVDLERRAGQRPRLRRAGDVIDVAVRAEDPDDALAARIAHREHAGGVAAGVDQHGLTRAAARGEVAVGGEGPDDRVTDDEHRPLPTGRPSTRRTSRSRRCSWRSGSRT